jgi:hypothetical protein
MFGTHGIPLSFETENIQLTVQMQDGYIVYQRKCNQEREEKTLMAKSGDILINPVEPINKPKEITNYLLIDLDKSVVVEPRNTHKIYLTFPVAIGVFIKCNRDYDILDIFTLASQKYTLYGDPQRGVICRYWESPVHTKVPNIEPLHLGIMELSIKNTTERWVPISKAVFNAYGMKIYYSNKLVSMKASMTILSENTAETQFLSSPLEKNMKKSVELYTARKLSILSSTFTMMDGI